jgi:hypothetical protein
MWGMGTYGRLGLGDEMDQYKPSMVFFPGPSVRVKQVALGERHTAAVCGKLFLYVSLFLLYIFVFLLISIF